MDMSHALFSKTKLTRFIKFVWTFFCVVLTLTNKTTHFKTQNRISSGSCHGSITIPQRNNSAKFSFRTILVFCSRRFSILLRRAILFIPDSSMAFLVQAITHLFFIVLLNQKQSFTIRLLKQRGHAGDVVGDEKKGQFVNRTSPLSFSRY